MNPVDVLKNDAVLLAHALNALFKGGVWEYLQAFEAIKDIDVNAFLSSYKDLAVNEDRQAIEAAFENALQLPNEAVMAKIFQGVSILEEGVDAVTKAVVVYKEILDAFDRAKKLIGA